MTYATKPIGLALVVLGLMAGAAGQARADLIYSTANDGSSLATIDPATGVSHVIGNFGTSFTYGLAYDPSTATLYANLDSGGALGTVNTTTGQAAPYAFLPAFGYPIVFDTSGNLYQLGTNNGVLYEINKANGSVLYAVQTSVSLAMGMASDNSGNLWVVTSGHLYEINKTNGSTMANVALIGEQGFGATMGLQIDSNNNFYATSYSSSSLFYHLNPSTGVLSTIGNTGLFFGHGGVYVTAVSPTPEPSTLVGAGTAALLGLAYAWRRRKRAAA